MARLTAALAATLVGVLAAGAQAAGDPARGRELAQKLCGRCHAWDPERPWNSIGSTPSFMWMARRLDFWRERILSVTDRRPHIAQKFDVTLQDLEDVLAYIETLKPEGAEARTAAGD